MTTPQTLRDLREPKHDPEVTRSRALYEVAATLAQQWAAVCKRLDVPEDYSAEEVIEVIDRLEAAERDSTRFAKALTEYGVHHGNCPLDSWSDRLTKCKCGLFRLIKDANRLLSQPHSAEEGDV